MSRNMKIFTVLSVLSLALAAVQIQAAPSKEPAGDSASAGPVIDLFKASKNKQADVTFIAKNDHEARLIVKNNTAQPLTLKLPEAFAGVPVAAQFGAGGGGAARGGGGGGFSGGGGGQQSVGGGGGGIGGGQQGGGGGGFFSVPPDKTVKINLPVVCLDHGLRDPSSSRPYKIVPIEDHIDRPAVIELLKAFGRGELQHDAVQAAAWHLNNDMSWQQLAAKQQGTRRTPNRTPYFTADAIRAGMAYANEASRLAVQNADAYAEAKRIKLEEEQAAAEKSSEERSTTDTDSIDPEPTKPANDDASVEDTVGTNAP
jgi:hypothetical protein